MRSGLPCRGPVRPAVGHIRANAQYVLVEKNLVDLKDAHPIQYHISDTMRSFANQTLNGAPIWATTTLASH